MTHYAEKTTVSVERSKVEIETTLSRYGADQFASGWSQTEAFMGRHRALHEVWNELKEMNLQ